MGAPDPASGTWESTNLNPPMRLPHPFRVLHEKDGRAHRPHICPLCNRARLQSCRNAAQRIRGFSICLTPHRPQDTVILSEGRAATEVERSAVAFLGPPHAHTPASQQSPTSVVPKSIPQPKICHPERSTPGAPRAACCEWGKRSEGPAFAFRPLAPDPASHTSDSSTQQR